MPKLTVCPLLREDVYKDIVRVSEECRFDSSKNLIEESTVCWIGGTPKKGLAILRGKRDGPGDQILMDERTRTRLGVCPNQSYEFRFRKAGLWGRLKWGLNASETSYRVAAEMAVVG